MFNSTNKDHFSEFRNEALFSFQKEKNTTSIAKWDVRLKIYAVIYRDQNTAIRYGCLNCPDKDGLVFGYEKGFSPNKKSYRCNN